MKEIVHDNMSMGSETNLEQANDLWGVMDAGWNFVWVLFIVRNYSYTGVAMMKGLHECRFFCAVAKPRLQRTLIEEVFN